jgi:membrane-associated phospholipid phosphatase
VRLREEASRLSWSTLVRGWTRRPARRDIVVYLHWFITLAVLFVLIYGSCNWITSQRTDLLSLYFEWERSIPFVPGLVWVYLSLFIIVLLPLFALREPELQVLGRRLALATAISGVVFLLLPAQLGFERPAPVPGHEVAFGVIYLLDLPHNLVPSLHISCSGLILKSVHAVSPSWMRRLIQAWFLLICAAVVLVHQHHVLDVLGGLLVAYAVTVAVRDTSITASSMTEKPSATYRTQGP